MRRYFDFRLWGSIAALVYCLFCATAASAQTRVALVIGNSTYQHVPVLVNPTNDAADVATALERLGFSVARVANGTFDNMRRGLLEFGPKARQAEMAVVFFAGHGMEVGGENWLIPVDAELKTDLDAEHEAIALKSIMLQVTAASKLGLVVLDACRNNPFAARMLRTTRTRAVGRGLTRVEPTGSVLVAYAARDGTTASDGSGRNSPFTSALLTHLETPGLEINFLFRNVRDDVLRATKRLQEPFVYGSLSKDAIYLKAMPRPPGPDELAWGLIKDTSDIAALRRFTAQYPQSPLRQQAEARIVALTEAEAARAATASQVDRRELARSLQLELRRVGCFDGSIDGEFGDATRAALRNFASFAAVKFSLDNATPDLLNTVRSFDKRVCPLVCQSGERAEGDRCIRMVCPSGHVLKDGACIAERTTTPTATAREAPAAKAPPAPKAGKKCFTFQNRQFCE